MYRTARCNYVIPNKLEEQTFERAASFYTTIGYTGVFLLAMDATAVIPMLKVKDNLLIGLATEEQVVLTTAQDIINIVKEDKEKAKQATAFLLSPLQEHVPPFILAISPLYKGQDHMNVRQWFNQAVLWAGRNGITVVGVGADGDSKVRKYYVERFRKIHGDRNDVIDIHYDSFDCKCVMEDLRDMGINFPIPTLMFPDWRHLIKKWRNQLLNVKRVLILGEGVVQIEHLMKTFEQDRMRCGLWKSDVFV